MKAKEIKRAIYGDNSTRAKDRTYVHERNGLGITIRNAPGSLRERYQKAKKAAR